MGYENSKVYRIVCNETGLCYIGSTIETLSRRLSKHKSDYKGYLNNNKAYMTSYKVLEKNNYEIFLIEEYPCDNRDQLHKRERYYIETIECVNKVIPSRTNNEYHKEWYKNNKEWIKIYRNENREKINELKRLYYKLNKQ